MKKIKYLLGFMLCAALIFCSCTAKPIDNPNESTSDTTDITETTAWLPDDNEPWNFTADGYPPPGSISNPHDETFDYELTLSQDTFDEVPAYIECQITNRTGDGVYCNMVYIETFYPNVRNIHSDISMEGTVGGWVRIPFIMEGYHLDEIAPGVRQGKIELKKYLKTDYQYTFGIYRIVFPLNDGTYYAYFEITK